MLTSGKVVPDMAELIYSYCASVEMDCEPGRINAGPFSLNVSPDPISVAVIVSQNLRRLRVLLFSIASRYRYHTPECCKMHSC
ncbi:hypothetical protein IBT54_004230 [Pantoea sp. S62]|nr:hypothetical protein [Pantoea sp. S62]